MSSMTMLGLADSFSLLYFKLVESIGRVSDFLFLPKIIAYILNCSFVCSVYLAMET